MTVELKGKDIAQQIEEQFPGAVEESSGNSVIVKADSLLSVAQFLKDTPKLNFHYLNTLTAVDYMDYFEVVYVLESFEHNHRLLLKTRAYGRENPIVPSVVSLWRGADLQEREVYDLMGVTFAGHPKMKRIVMWEGFQGHPLRRDYL